MRAILLGSIAGPGLALLLMAGAAAAQEKPSLFDFMSETDPPSFATADEAVGAFKDALAADDFNRVAELLGLDATKLATDEGVQDTYQQIKTGTAKKLSVKNDEDREILNIGDELWPLPFPLVKGDDGRWAFDTESGIEEIINRRIGENELQAIDTARSYVDAQKDYQSEDHDADGVLEYAQKLISTEGQHDGLYWPAVEGEDDSPAGMELEQAQLDKAKAGDGYFGYTFRILDKQGENIAGGAYDYVINGNMIGGFALIARPVTYEETGTQTFVVNQAGIVYQKDLGKDTAALADAITAFDPDESWQIVPDFGTGCRGREWAGSAGQRASGQARGRSGVASGEVTRSPGLTLPIRSRPRQRHEDRVFG